MAQRTQRAQVARAEVAADKRLRSVVDSLDHPLDGHAGVRDDCKRRLGGAAAMRAGCDVQRDGGHLGCEREHEGREPVRKGARDHAGDGLEHMQGHALAFPQEEERAQGEVEELRHRGCQTRSEGAPSQYEHQDAVSRHVGQAAHDGSHHGVEHMPAIADERDAAGGKELKGNAPHDDAHVGYGVLQHRIACPHEVQERVEGGEEHCHHHGCAQR